MGSIMLTVLQQAIDPVHPVQFSFLAPALLASLLDALDFEVESRILWVDTAQRIPLAQRLAHQVLLFVLAGLRDNGVDQVASFSQAGGASLEVVFVRVSLERFFKALHGPVEV